MTAESSKGPFWGQRHTQSLLLFFAIVVNYMVKYNASVSVVAMTNAETTNPNFEQFDWNEKEKSYILSSFFWGYVITQLPGGYLARRFGVKRIMLFGTFGTTVFSILTPVCVPLGGWQVYCAIRMVQGLFQGPLFPCVYAHLAVWSPVNERTRLGALTNSGYECGIVMAMYLTGTLAASSMGWPSISYVSAGFGVVWCIFWVVFGANTPDKSKFISKAERDYISLSKTALKSSTDQNNITPTREIPVPWKAILTSVPFWILIEVRSAQAWGFNSLQSEMPSYMNGVLNMDMKDNAIFSALPYLAMWVMSYVYLVAADILLNRKILSLNAIRKSINSISFVVPAFILIGIGFLGEQDKVLAIVLMTLNVGINAGGTIGSALNTIDLSPNHAGILMSFVNTTANLVATVTPLVVGVIVVDVHDRTQWQIVFSIAAIIFIVGNLLYVIFGSTERQPWDDEDFLKMKEIQNEEGTIKPIEELQTPPSS